jgi:hypothetical protein
MVNIQLNDALLLKEYVSGNEDALAKLDTSLKSTVCTLKIPDGTSLMIFSDTFK